MISWTTAPSVTVYRPGCPRCGSWAYVLVRSCQNGDGSVTRLAVCKRCSCRFKIIVELPLSGRPDAGDWYDSRGGLKDE